MAQFPYTPKPSSLIDFLGRIQTVGVPDKVTAKYLTSLGFKSSNDRCIPGILKSLGFIDSSGVPQDRWRNYRDKKQAAAELATAIREAYSQLFSVYPDAYRRDDEALRDFFASSTSVGEKAILFMATTFRKLCDLADFRAASESSPSPECAAAPTAELLSEKVHVDDIQTSMAQRGIAVNINIQLSLPETKDDSIYDKIFASLKRHLLSQ